MPLAGLTFLPWELSQLSPNPTSPHDQPFNCFLIPHYENNGYSSTFGKTELRGQSLSPSQLLDAMVSALPRGPLLSFFHFFLPCFPQLGSYR